MKKSTIFQASASEPEKDEPTESSRLANYIFLCTYVVAFLFFVTDGVLQALAKAAIFLMVVFLLVTFTSDFSQ